MNPPVRDGWILCQVADQTVHFLAQDQGWTVVFDEVKVFTSVAEAKAALATESVGIKPQYAPWLELAQVDADLKITTAYKRTWSESQCCMWTCSKCEASTGE